MTSQGIATDFVQASKVKILQ